MEFLINLLRERKKVMMARTQALKHLQSITDNTKPLVFMLGPCAIENESDTRKTAEFLKKLSQDLKFTLIFKSSFDKANRTSLSNYRSVGLKEGMRILGAIREDFDVPIVTDIHEPWQAGEVAHCIDVIQIPAFLFRQTDLLAAAAKTGKIINIKKGQFASAPAAGKAAEKVVESGNKNVWLCERGYAFGYGDLIVDFRNFALMKQMGYPVIYDATHSVQKPSALGGSSGGDRTMVANLAISAVAQGIAGLFMEVHKEPEKALCDGPNSVRLSQLRDFLVHVIELDAWVKERAMPLIC
jgi:2-dehydro-3-deoxyphosphooctonate aldolase (KDO 8-P synthase)